MQMNRGRVWFLAITAALGGFLFGFDTIVINGAEQDIQKLWGLSGAVHGWVISAALWVLIAEVFPQKFRAQGQALGSFTHWFFAALIALTFPLAAESVPAWAIFGFFGVAMVFHLLWAIFIVPETKGKSLDELAALR